MNRIKVKPLRLFKMNSVFTTTLITLLLLCLIITVLYSFTFTNIMIDNNEMNTVRENAMYLRGVVDNVDIMLENLQQVITQITSNRDVFSLAASKAINNNTLSATKMFLTSIADNSPLIKNVSVYVPRIDCIATSKYRSYTFESFPNNALIEGFERGEINASPIEFGGRTSYIVFYESKIYIVRRFNMNSENALAELFVEIDTSTLYDALLNEKGVSNIWVFDQFYEPVLTKEAYYPTEAVDMLGRLEETNENSFKNEAVSANLQVSEQSGWKFLYICSGDVSKPGFETIIKAALPVLVTMAVISIVISIIIARILYRPFLRLLNAMENHDLFPTTTGSDTYAYRNEFTYIFSTLSQVAERQKYLDRILSETVEDVLNRFFANILKGVPISYGTTKEVLASTRSPFMMNAPYVVSVIRLENGVFGLENNNIKMLIAQIHKYFHEQYSGEDILTHVLIDGNEMQIIAMFDMNYGAIQIKKRIGSLEEFALKIAKQQDIKMKFASGNIYYSILDLNFSYKDAVAALDSESNADSEVTEVKTVEIESDDHPETALLNTELGTNVNQKAQHLLDLCISGDQDGTRIYYERVVDDICQRDRPINEQIKYCKRFVSALMDKMVRVEYINLSALPENLFEFVNSDDEYESSEQLQQVVCDTCERIVSELSGLLKKQQNRHLLAAREYISHHYQDYDLSLTSIADAISANPSYLSKLFKTNLDVYFTDYLNNYRLDRSLEMLKNTDETVQEIAAATGFNSAQNYIRVFKKRMNMTPGLYRKSARADSEQ